jgi:hypothetical protein
MFILLLNCCTAPGTRPGHVIIFTPAIESQIDACRHCDPRRPLLHHGG